MVNPKLNTKNICLDIWSNRYGWIIDVYNGDLMVAKFYSATKPNISFNALVVDVEP